MIDKRFWNNKKILITGYNGFKGSWMTLLLSKLGAKVFGYALNNEYEKKNNKILNLKKNCIDVCNGNILEKKKFYKFLKKSKPEIIIHMASQSLISDSYLNPLKTYETNTTGLVNLLNFGINHKDKKKLLFFILTSDKCYENLDNKRKFEENDNLNGDDPYSGSKACQEIICNSYRKSFNLNIATARAGNVIGGCDFNENRLMVDLTEGIFKNKKVFIRNIKSTRPWQHVIDLNLNYLEFIEKFYFNKELAGPWNFGPEKSYSVKKIIQILNKKKKFKYSVNKISKREKSFLNISNKKIKNKLNIKNRISFIQSLNLTYNWYEKFYNNRKNIYNFSLKQLEDFLNETKYYR